MFRFLLHSSLFVSWLFAGTLLAYDPVENYSARVAPLLKVKCVPCHGNLKQEGGLRLDTGAFVHRGAESGSILPSKTAPESVLLQRIVSTDPDTRMPPEGEPLDEGQIDLLREWVNAGAPFPTDEVTPVAPKEHWSFQPLQTNALKYGQIDEFINAKLQARQLAMSNVADRATRIRRLYLVMHGLPPTPEQLSRAINSDQPDWFERAVDEVLSSPRYGEHWAQHWLDVIRYADTHGYEVNTSRPNAWPYRDYVIAAFNNDKPYDRFVFEQIAGDSVGEDAATGFLVAAPVLLPGQIGADDASKRLARQDALSEVIAGTSQAILGLTIGCARCHDHKFDPITQDDYYALQSYFAGVEYEDRPMKDESDSARQQKATELADHINSLQRVVAKFEPKASQLSTRIIDDEDLDRVEILKPKNGHGVNPEGTERGFRDDRGDLNRIGNIGRGRYTWWDNHPGEDVFVYRPKLAGRYRLWLSWGVHGSGVHTRDARYVFDQDGDLTTRNDQCEVASIDQYYPAYVKEGTTPQIPLWSGLFDAGEWDWSDTSCLIVRGGETQTGITADAIVLQQPKETGDSRPRESQPIFRAPVNAKFNTEQFSPIEAKLIRFTSLETIDQNRHEPCIDELEVFAEKEPTTNIALGSKGCKATSSGNYSDIGIHQLPHIFDGNYGNSFSWISNEQGKGWVQIELPRSTKIDRIQWGRDRKGEFADRLAIRYRIEVAGEDGVWHPVASSDDRLPYGTPFQPENLLRGANEAEQQRLAMVSTEIAELQKRKTELEQPKLVFAGRFREPDVTQLLRRGDPEQPIKPVAHHLPAIFASTRSSGSIDTVLPEQKRRVELAQWLSSAQNPLTARVLVNRIWQHHFGVGLVETSNDFGLNGIAPSHPELLDWLAAELIRSNWSIKHIQRLILLSDTFNQSSQINASARRVDSDNRLLSYYPTRRLEAESIRDSSLLVSGLLNLSMGGPGFDFFRSRGGLDGFPPIEDPGPNELKRMIYSHKIRMEPVPVFGAFDCPDAGQPLAKRSQSTTAIQALNLFNSPLIYRFAKSLAQRVEREQGSDPSLQIDAMFQLTVGRSPGTKEMETALPIVKQYGLTSLGRALLNSSEFLFIP